MSKMSSSHSTANSDPIRTDLPSTVEETLAVYSRFRILVVGNSGVGKSSLVSSIFNLKLNDIDIAHDRAGKANIDFGYMSDENPRFILHDSQGFVSGSNNNWEIVEKFLRHRNTTGTPVKERVHAIWLCIVTPRSGGRLLQTGDESLLKLARDLNIPVIVVFTKYDLLVIEHFRVIKAKGDRTTRERISATNAQADFTERIEAAMQLTGTVSCVKVSATTRKYAQTLQDLTNTTRKILDEVGGELWIPWAIAQQVNAHQKIDASITEGFKKYWVDLGRSSIFPKHRIIECVWRIHDDIVKVWNFNDPKKLLAGQDFLEGLLLFVRPLTEQLDAQNTVGESTRVSDSLLSLAKGVSPFLSQFVRLGIAAFGFLCGLYEQIPLASQYLGTYIVNITLVLHRLLMTTLAQAPPRVLTPSLIKVVLDGHKDAAAAILHRIRSFPAIKLEERVRDLIKEQVGHERE